MIHPKIEGMARYHAKTKHLIPQLKPGDIAFLSHQDIDPLAAESLAERKIQAVVNVEPSMSGKFQHDGVRVLLNRNIPVFDIEWKRKAVEDFFPIKIENNQCLTFGDGQWNFGGEARYYDEDRLAQLKRKALCRHENEFRRFAKNSLYHADKDLSPMLDSLFDWKSQGEIRGKEVLLVIRGTDYEKDLQAIKRWVKKKKLYKIAVDGAADGMFKHSLRPDLLIGDMDSVSEQACRKVSRILVHCRVNGESPGKKRLDEMKVAYESLPFIGMSEDAAIAWACKEEAARLYIVGGHRGMEEYLCKGRKGMGSSLLLRMWAGCQVTDLKGIHYLKESPLPAYNIEKIVNHIRPLVHRAKRRIKWKADGDMLQEEKGG